MKINFKTPRYVIPLIVLPFMFVFFYAYKSFDSHNSHEKTTEKDQVLKINISEVSDEVKNEDITGKLDALSNRYKNGDGYTAVNNLELDDYTNKEQIPSSYNEREKQMLDSINNLFNSKYNNKHTASLSHQNSVNSHKNNKDLQNALTFIEANKDLSTRNQPQEKYQDPMLLFREQMAIIDSIGKANDPENKLRKKKEAFIDKVDQGSINTPKLSVIKVDDVNNFFNTIRVEKEDDFIKAVIDESITGSAGSRLRIRLLDDIRAGKYLIKKGSYLYALISGFQEQRVHLTITSIRTDNKILPVKLELYDLDGILGLYVPASAFREFTKELTDIGQIQMQQDPSTATQLYMSAIQKIFTSTSSAVSKLIRQNKAKMKYGSHVYLIDPDELKEQQNNY